MDVVIEGKITRDESMSEVIQTVVDLKTLPNAILRISSTDSAVQGRIQFSQGGYILGGRLTGNDDETGYSAVRKLLLVSDGNYAVLDPGRTHIPDVNQSLWIKASRVQELLPHLPDSPDSLLDANPDALPGSKQQVANMDLKVSSRDETPVVADAKKSKARKTDIGKWRATQIAIWAIAAISAAAITKYADQIYAFLHNTFHF